MAETPEEREERLAMEAATRKAQAAVQAELDRQEAAKKNK